MGVSYSLLDLTSIVRAVGRPSIFYATGEYAGSGNDLSLTHLGDTEGEVTVEPNSEFNALTVPELTGPAIHKRYHTGDNPVVSFSLYPNTKARYDLLSPYAGAHGGYFRQQEVTKYSLVLIPEELTKVGTLAYTNGGTWTVGGDALTSAQQALLDRAVWFWSGHFERTMPRMQHEDGGKELVDVVFQVLWNSNMPDGHRLFTVGDPYDASIEIAAA